MATLDHHERTEPMNLDELRASILEHLGITLDEDEDEDEHEDLDGVHDDVLITATGTHFDALTDWLDATDTGRHIHLDRTGDV